MYRLETHAPVSPAEAEGLGRWMVQYAIKLGSLTVRDVMPDGRTHINNAATKTVTQVAGAGGAGIALAPAAVVIGVAFPVISIPALLGILVADTGLMHQMNKRSTTAGTDHSRIEFTFANVSDDRRKWAEYLLARYAADRGWDLTGLRFPEQLAAGGRATRDPIPWSTRGGRREKRTR